MMRELTIAGDPLCLAAAAVLVVASHLRRPLLAPLGELLDGVLADRPARVTLMLFWWWIGWHFFVAQTIDPALG